MARAKKPRPAPITPPVLRVEREFFGGVGVDEHRVADITYRQDRPSCFNGIVRVHRYRVTVERIEEPVEVIRDRLLKLWRESDNHHYYSPLQGVAERLGVELPAGDFGRDRKRAGLKERP
jgi:hypothetical protein